MSALFDKLLFCKNEINIAPVNAYERHDFMQGGSSLMRQPLDKRRFGAASAPHGQTAKFTARTIAGTEAVIQARQDWLRGAHT